MEERSERLQRALDAVEQMALAAADKLIAGRICWHGREAVAAALLEGAVSNMVDNLHDDPSYYEEAIEEALAESKRDGRQHP